MTTPPRVSTESVPRPRDLAELQRRLSEAEETLQAIRNGAVDAFLVRDGDVDRVYTLETADRPYRTMVESMRQGALVLGRDGTILFANSRCAEMLQVPPERLTAATLSSFVDEADRPSLEVLLRAAGAIPARGGISLVRADGSVVPTEIALNALPGHATATLCAIVTDLTQQRQYEELRQAQTALKEADRRKDEFLATLAHELRNPLAPIRSAVQILRLDTAAASERAWAQNVIDRQVQQMSRLVDDLLELSRITRGEFNLRREMVELASVLHAAIETSQPQIRQGEHELTVSLPPGPVYLEADPARLAQVFANLLNNAAKFTERAGKISIAASRDGSSLLVSVRDNGLGIPPANLTQVFDIFTRVDHGPDRSAPGLGIGLAIVKQIVDLHGGSIEAKSEGPGTGSEFIVRLPLVEQTTASGEVVAATEPTWPLELRVLVVDDSQDNADSLSVMLRLMGCEIRTVYDGRSALDTGATFQPDVVLMDLGMPTLDGYATCGLLRAQPWGRKARIIALSGWGQEEDRIRTDQAGFDHHLVKPVDPRVLAEVLAAPNERAPS